MASGPPPARYRVVERGGRLVVIDTAVGGPPLTARDLVPGTAPPHEDRPVDHPADDDAPVARAIPDPGPPSKSLSRPPAARALIAEPPGALASIAATVAGDVRDDNGRLNWDTAPWFDAKGRRTIALSPAGERVLGGAVALLLAALVVEVMLLVWATTFGIVVGFIALSLLRQVKPVATAWIDRLARA